MAGEKSANGLDDGDGGDVAVVVEDVEMGETAVAVDDAVEDFGRNRDVSVRWEDRVDGGVAVVEAEGGIGGKSAAMVGSCVHGW